VAVSRTTRRRTTGPRRSPMRAWSANQQTTGGTFRSDLIREIFDGGFGAEVDESTPFKVLFTSYVESYFKSCRASLPANHNRDHDDVGHGESRESFSATSSARIPTIRSPSRPIRGSRRSIANTRRLFHLPRVALSILTSGRRVNTLLNPLLDIAQFFEDQKCQGPAMHQLTENLLRGALDKNSLQQAGETIAGAGGGHRSVDAARVDAFQRCLPRLLSGSSASRAELSQCKSLVLLLGRPIPASHDAGRMKRSSRAISSSS